MEQLNVVTQQDNERIFNILSDLLSKDKAFQIMITVPAGDKSTGDEAKKLLVQTTRGCLIPAAERMIWRRTLQI